MDSRKENSNSIESRREEVVCPVCAADRPKALFWTKDYVFHCSDESLSQSMHRLQLRLLKSSPSVGELRFRLSIAGGENVVSKFGRTRAYGIAVVAGAR